MEPFFAVFWGPPVANPLPPTPFQNLDFKHSPEDITSGIAVWSATKGLAKRSFREAIVPTHENEQQQCLDNLRAFGGLLVVQGRQNPDRQRRGRILLVFLPPESGQIWGDFLAKLHHKNMEKKGKSTGENSETKNPVETAPRNCRFLSLVVAERVLRTHPGVKIPKTGKRVSGSKTSGTHFPVPH